MAFIWMPDNPAQQQPYGNPYPYGFNPAGNAESEALRVAKAIIKKDKAEKKAKAEKDKKEADAKKPRVFTLGETVGIVALSAIPLVMLQLAALNYIQVWFLTIAAHP